MLVEGVTATENGTEFGPARNWFIHFYVQRCRIKKVAIAGSRILLLRTLELDLSTKVSPKDSRKIELLRDYWSLVGWQL